MKRFLLLAMSLVIFGAGCAQNVPAPTTQAPPPVLAPTLEITNPQNGLSTTANTITVEGTTDAGQARVNGIATVVVAGHFSYDVTLKAGDNVIQIDVTNQTATSSATILIKRTSTAPGATGTAKPKTTATAPSSAPTGVQFVADQLQLSITLSTSWAALSWTKSPTPQDIKGYGVIKSTTDPNPYYPKEFYVYFLNNPSIGTWNDTAIKSGVRTYYRICSIGNDNSIRCGNVVSVVKP